MSNITWNDLKNFVNRLPDALLDTHVYLFDKVNGIPLDDYVTLPDTPTPTEGSPEPTSFDGPALLAKIYDPYICVE